MSDNALGTAALPAVLSKMHQPGRSSWRMRSARRAMKLSSYAE